MTSIRKAALACVASALLALPLGAAAQSPRNQDTFFTFSQNVELPNKTLPAGKYLLPVGGQCQQPAHRESDERGPQGNLRDLAGDSVLLERSPRG